jgi:hypothetical protein
MQETLTTPQIGVPIVAALLITAGYFAMQGLSKLDTSSITTNSSRVATVTPLPENIKRYIDDEGNECEHITLFSPDENVRCSVNVYPDGQHDDFHYTDQNVPKGRQGRHTPEPMPTLPVFNLEP